MEQDRTNRKIWNMLNCLITEVRFDDHKIIRRGNRNEIPRVFLI